MLNPRSDRSVGSIFPVRILRLWLGAHTSHGIDCFSWYSSRDFQLPVAVSVIALRTSNKNLRESCDGLRINFLGDSRYTHSTHVRDDNLNGILIKRNENHEILDQGENFLFSAEQNLRFMILPSRSLRHFFNVNIKERKSFKIRVEIRRQGHQRFQ